MCFYSVWAFEVHHSAAEWGLPARLHVFYQSKWPWCLPNLIWLHLASQSQKRSKKHFFPELSGDLWGVICYHHWYPRAGLEAPGKSYFSQKVLRLKKMQNYPLSIFHAAVRPESLPGADLSTFWKVRFSLFSGLFGPLGPNYSYSINYFNIYLGKLSQRDPN